MEAQENQDQLRLWASEIENLKKKAYHAETTAQMDFYFKQILGLRSRHEAVRRKLQEVCS